MGGNGGRSRHKFAGFRISARDQVRRQEDHFGMLFFKEMGQNILNIRFIGGILQLFHLAG